MDNSKGPHRVNRAHWPTKESKTNSEHFFDFFGPWKKWPQMAPNGTLEVFVPTNPDLANIFGRTDLNFENFYVFDFLDPKISGLSRSRISGFPRNLDSPTSKIWISRPPQSLKSLSAILQGKSAAW